MKRKIAIIIERADIALGGAERSVFELASALSARDLQVDILAAKGRAKAKDIHILCGTKPGSRTWFFTFAGALKKHLAENHYDIVHSVLPFDFADVYQPRGGSFAEAILRNACSYQNRFIQNYKKATAFVNFRRAVLLHAEKKLCNNPNGPIIAALSKYVADQFRQRYNLDDGRLVIIPNGVKIDEQIDTTVADKLRAQILAKLNLKEADTPILFLFAANNFRLKGLTVLIEAMHLAVARHGDSMAYLVVAGRDGAHPYRHLAKKLKVDTKIVFLGSVHRIQNILSITDVAAVPTFYDPSSRFTLEALAAGKPVITTSFNGATDLFSDNIHGKVIACPRDVSRLAEAIAYFANPDNIRKAAQAITADNLREKISIKRTAQLTEALYESIIEKRGRK
jgi:UDP-glucose:(heptosyl)LPS alpha-1,3-glucosyltransferase